VPDFSGSDSANRRAESLEISYRYFMAAVAVDVAVCFDISKVSVFSVAAGLKKG
jgi:hypothetical protein